jgi:glyoxylase-like metal-dependent hydrolase (beta-lactamase superfamily II)
MTFSAADFRFDARTSFLNYRAMTSTNILRRVFFFLISMLSMLAAPVLRAEVNQVEKIAPEIYFHEGEIKGKGHCNNGWIIFDDYVLVVDANFPSGARVILPKIKELTDKPIRFAFDTHHHGDHAYGNQFWVEQGAVPVAHTGVLEEMAKYEPTRWNDTARSRADMGGTKLKPPTLLYQTEMFFDDGKHRAELRHFGVAHTHGDGFVWLPKEKILFTGDACVNGAFNYLADGDTGQWIQTLENAKKLGAKIVCPGHGPRGDAQLLDDQQKYFVELRAAVKKYADKKPEEVKAAGDEIKKSLEQQERIKKFVPASILAHVEKVYVEMGGQPFPKTAAVIDARKLHLIAHGGSAEDAGR